MSTPKRVTRTGPTPKRVAGRYTIEAELGHGGMGVVYRAHDDGTGKPVALKLLESLDERMARLFEREYETLAKLDHPRVIAVYDYGIADNGQRYYTMELLGGSDISVLAPLPWRTVCGYMRDVCASLALLHARRLVHRDINPRNVRLDDQGQAKLLDFGAVASFGVASELVGTPSCMAPESLRGGGLDARTDLFALGVVMYWALTRERPYDIQSLADAEAAWSRLPRAPVEIVPSIPPALSALVLTLISVDPLGRPASAADVIDRLGAIAQLDDELPSRITEGRLAPFALLGRGAEQLMLEQLLSNTLRGKGNVVSIAGESGLGRSHLAHDLCIDARLAGLRTLFIDSARYAEEGGLMHGLVQQLLSTVPDDARATTKPYQANLDVWLPR